MRVAAAGKESVSVFKPVQFFGKIATLMQVDIPTGRTHQIRVHAAYAGHPLLGDDKYGDRERNAELKGAGLEADISTRPVDRIRLAGVRACPFMRAHPCLRISRRCSMPSRRRSGPPPAGARGSAARAPEPSGNLIADAPQDRTSRISGKPTRAVGSSLLIVSHSEIPSPSLLKPPAQSRGDSRAM